MLGFEPVQAFHHCDVVDVRELVGRGHRANAVRFAFCAHSVHKLAQKFVRIVNFASVHRKGCSS